MYTCISLSLLLLGRFSAQSPINDLCLNAENLNSGNNTLTCMATLDPPDNCGGTESDIWFKYLPNASADGVSISIENIDMSGMVTIEIFSGTCSNLVPLDGANLPFCGVLASEVFELSCLPSEYIYVKVGSSAAGCGSFNISAADFSITCNDADACLDITTEIILPSTGAGYECYQACNDHTCNEPGDCGDYSTWVQVRTDNEASSMFIEANVDFEHTLTVFEGPDCDNLTITTVECSPDLSVNLGVSGNSIYWIRLELTTGDPGDIEICVATFEEFTDCVVSATIVSSREIQEAPPEGPFCPGEIVHFCYILNYLVSTAPPPFGNNCQFLQGIIPVIGEGWDLDAMPIENADPGIEWEWLKQGSVDYNVNNPFVDLITLPNGNLGLEYGNGGLSPGDIMPSGWWAVSFGPDFQCANDGDPDNMLGLGSFSCNTVQSVTICFDLQVKTVDDFTNCSTSGFSDLDITFFTFADGETGCDISATCAFDTPAFFEGEIDCTPLVETVYTGIPELCNDESLNIDLSTIDGSTVDIQVIPLTNPNIEGTEFQVFTGGSGLLKDLLTNLTDEVQFVTYEISTIAEDFSFCQGPILELEVAVYPDMFVTFEEEYNICFGDQLTIVPEVTGGTESGLMYQWLDMSTEPSVSLPLVAGTSPGSYAFAVTVTDDLGCTAESEFEYTILNIMTPEIEGDEEVVCIDENEELASLEIQHPDIGYGPYTYQWYSNPGGLAFANGNNQQTVIIDEERSESGIYTVVGIVIDKYGCDFSAEFQFTIEVGPELYFEVTLCYPDEGGNVFEVLGGNYEIDPATFTIFDEEGEDIAGPVDGNFIDAFIGDPGIYTLEGVDEYGCPSYLNIEIFDVPDPIISVIPSDTICSGEPVTISIENDNVYSYITWSTGEEDDDITIAPLDTTTIYILLEDKVTLCQISDSVEIIVHPIPDAIITGSTSFCPGGATELTALGQDTFTYLWTRPFQDSIYGQTISVTDTGLYHLEVTTEYGCTNTSFVTISESGTLNPFVGDANLCTGDTILLDAGAGFDVYIWSDSHGDTLSTVQNAVVTQGGIYTLYVSIGDSTSFCSGSTIATVSEFEPLPIALNAASTSACNINTGLDSTIIDLTTFQLTDGNWSDGNGFIIVDPASVDFTGFPEGDYSYTFETTGATAPCENQVYNFVVSVSDCSCPELNAISTSSGCTSGDTILLSSLVNSSETGTWSILSGPDINGLNLENNNTLIIKQDATAGEYSLEFQLTGEFPPACTTQINVPVNIVSPPVVIFQNDVFACNADTESGPVCIDLDTLLLSPATGIWSSSETGIVIDQENVVDFIGLDPGSYNFEFTTSDAISPPCSNITQNLSIEVVNCACPHISLGPLPAFCITSEDIVVTTYFDNPEDIPGSWSLEGPVTGILNDSLIDLSNGSPGQYTLTYLLDEPPLGNCPSSLSTTFNLYAPPELELFDQGEACNIDTGNGPVVLDLDDFIVTASPGTWRSSNSALEPGLDNTVDFTGITPGLYTFSYSTSSAQPPCTDIEDSIIVEVMDCACPVFNLNVIEDLCTDGEIINLNDYLANPENLEGTWTATGPGSINVVGSLLDPSGVLPGIYTVSFVLQSPPGGNCPYFTTVEISIHPEPQVSITEAVTVCNGTDVTPFPTHIDLDTLTNGSTGSWSFPGNFPGIFEDSTIINFAGQNPGTHVLLFTTNTAIFPCTDQVGELTLTIEDCRCPTLEFIAPPQLCNTDVGIDLNSLPTSETGEGTWTFIGGPITVNLEDQSNFEVFGLPEGIYTFLFSLSSESPDGCIVEEDIAVEILAQDQITHVLDTIVCNTTSVLAPVCLDFNGLVTGANGLWSAPPGFTGSFNDITRVCFEGEVPGTTYSFVFTSSPSNAACPEVSVESLVEIIDCRCPEINILPADPLCNDSGYIDLGVLVGPGTVQGSWTFSSGPQSIVLQGLSGFNVTGIEGGVYTFTYTLSETPAIDCDASQQVEIEIIQVPYAGLGSNFELCADQPQSIFLDELLDGEDVNGTWFETSVNPSTGNGFQDNVFNTSNQAPGIYSFLYSVAGIMPCPTSEEVVSVTIHALPNADAGEDKILTCEENAVSIGHNIPPDPNLSYTWETQEGIDLSNQKGPNIENITAEGLFFLTVQNTMTGCSQRDTVEVRASQEIPVFDLTVQNSPCFQANAGAISLTELTGGTPPYTISLNNITSTETVYSNLSPGAYNIWVTDSNGCTSGYSNILISEPPLLTVDAGEDMDFDYYVEDYEITAVPSVTSDSVSAVEWFENGISLCSGPPSSCLTIAVNPGEFATYCVQITTLNGCIADECITLRVRVVKDIFLPTVFSPNGDGNNDIFYVQTDQFIESVSVFEVYDRWGNIIFKQNNESQPNDPANGWDGTYNQSYVVPGVYIYRIEVRFTDGATETIIGDITVLR